MLFLLFVLLSFLGPKILLFDEIDHRALLPVEHQAGAQLIHLLIFHHQLHLELFFEE